MGADYVRCVSCGHVRTWGDWCRRCCSRDGEELDYGYLVRCAFCGNDRPHTKKICLTCGAEDFEGQEYSWCDKATLRRIRDSDQAWILEGPISRGAHATINIPRGLTPEQEEAFAATYWPGMEACRKQFTRSTEERETWWQRLWRLYGPTWS